MIEAHISSFPESDQDAVRRVYEVARALAPDATEGESYGVPALRLAGKPLVAVSSARSHLTLMPFSARVVAEVVARFPGLDSTKGTIRFTAAEQAPTDALEAMLRARMAEIAG